MYAFLLLNNYRFPFSVYTFPCTISPCVFSDCHAFKLRVVNKDYAISSIHSEFVILARRVQYLGLKLNPEQISSVWHNSVMGISVHNKQEATPPNRDELKRRTCPRAVSTSALAATLRRRAPAQPSPRPLPGGSPHPASPQEAVTCDPT